MRSAIRKSCGLLLIGLLAGLVSGCDDADRDPAPPGFGELGGVVVAEGEAVQIRSLLSHAGWAEAAETGRDAIEIAVDDFGDVHGHGVVLGLPINSMCSPAGGTAAANQVIADKRIVGVIGTSCSGAGAAASKLLSAAGLVMISPSNTSPSLTSDLEGNRNANNYPGYFRLSNNDLHTGRAVADFIYNELNLRKIGTVDIDDAYVAGLETAFRNAFEKLGGEVVVRTRIVFHDMPGFMASITTASNELVAAGDMEGIFFPLYPEQAEPFLKQLPAALRKLKLIGADTFIVPDFLMLEETDDLYMAGPLTTFGNQVNGATGRSEAEVRETIETAYGDSLGAFWQHSYDAATLLLDAIKSVAKPQDGKLYIDRAELRLELAATDNFQGLIGTISCDEFGDCGDGRTNILHNKDMMQEVVYTYMPMP